MKNNFKLMGIATSATLAVTLLAGCPGTGLPTTTEPGANAQPGFFGTVTNNGDPVKGATLWLKSYSGQEGSLAGGTAVANTKVETDGNGLYFIPAPKEALDAGALFGVGYDVANTEFGGNRDNLTAGNLKNQIQWFSSPAVNLKTKTGNRANVSFDIYWNTAGFEPANGAAVQGPAVTFKLTEKKGATKYEVRALKGKVAGSGAEAFKMESPETSIMWDDAANGDYVYQAKAFMASGVAGVTANDQMAAPWFTFTVTGAQ